MEFSSLLLRLVCIGFLLGGAPSGAGATDGLLGGALPGTGNDTGKTVIYRDSWGIPHIYAPTDEAGLYAQGYAMAQDRPERLLLNMLTAIGELSAVAGEDAVQSDLRSHLFDHYGAARENWDQIPTIMRRHTEMFVAGINAFYSDHPRDIPAWWQGRQVDKYMVIAFGRLFLYNWSIDEAYGDLRRSGIEPGYEPAERGSNQFAVSPQRTSEGAAILAIDPHLAWFGPSRFWEFRIHAGALHGSGVTLAGFPYIGLGHNENMAWAMTTGGPDTADVYALTLKEGDNRKYLYDGKWRTLLSRSVTLEVKGEPIQNHTLWFSHNGPIIAWQDGVAYAAAMAYGDMVNISSAWFALNYGQDYRAAIEGMASLSVFPQNVMVADTSGNIYYQRTGRVPVRPAGFDWARAVDGSTSASAWQGFHPASDHLQVLNPPQGYMQNCNIPPDAMIPDSPFSPADAPDYLYSGPGYGPARSGWTNQRGARAIELLQADDSITTQDAMAIINDTHPYGAERWISALKSADEKYGGKFKSFRHYEGGITQMLEWDGSLDRNSAAALKYYYWREQLEHDLSATQSDRQELLIDDWYAIVEGRPQKPLRLDDRTLEKLVSAFLTAMVRLAADFDRVNPVYGDLFRVGRGENSWPLGGGGRFGTRTLRSVGYAREKKNHRYWGARGQTSTQIVVLSRPIRSWIYLPIGQSDRRDSRHYSDQAEKLFSQRKLKPSWWLPQDLKDHIQSRTVLDQAPR
jgi:acyl-homoserine lactone acylase PvdQ|tara:strand:+ start:13767 stop:15989 length:2223 start_codon:yes stop_codon:yes gene_type:complete